MSVDYRKAPFPWFGGKADAAPAVWAALGDVEHYVEPFAGSLAVLLRRPHPCNRTYYSETVNDVDGLLVNAWRSIQLSPRETAEAASWPVSEADMHARHLALLRWRADRELEHLMGDPLWHDPVMGGWWLWGQSCWIGTGWCSGEGPWVAGADGRIVKRDGPGVSRKLPSISDDGRAVARPQLRAEGVARQKPHTASDGQGVARPQLRNEGVGDFHPMTMPDLLRWMEYLSARLRHVRILNGDWKRACTSGATRTINVRQGGHVGIFLDQPYTTEAERAAVYSHEDMDVGHAVREWALKRGADADTRIVLAGYDVEHVELESHGWTAVEWYREGWLKGGMGNVGKAGNQQHRERLWLSPHCLRPELDRQVSLW